MMRNRNSLAPNDPLHNLPWSAWIPISPPTSPAPWNGVPNSSGYYELGLCHPGTPEVVDEVVDLRLTNSLRERVHELCTNGWEQKKIIGDALAKGNKISFRYLDEACSSTMNTQNFFAQYGYIWQAIPLEPFDSRP